MIALLLSMLLMVSCAGQQGKTYTASTPAETSIRSFLGIPLSDSVDFIRWKLTVVDSRYQLQCNYGISKPNTNGFINGGTTIQLKGECRKENKYYHFQNGTKTLKALELNADLLHLLNANSELLVGNGGWSYTLNHTNPSGLRDVSLAVMPAAVKDSMVFEGRTPCKVPGIIPPGAECYKLKWYIVFYPANHLNNQGHFRILGTPWRSETSKTGTWQTNAAQNGYLLNDEQGNGFLYLLKLDNNILVFTDAKGKPLVGDEDFSYTLNRKW